VILQGIAAVTGNSGGQTFVAASGENSFAGKTDFEPEEEPLPNDQIMNLIAGWADGN
jgi:hypothetical protein